MNSHLVIQTLNINYDILYVKQILQLFEYTKSQTKQAIEVINNEDSCLVVLIREI